MRFFAIIILLLASSSFAYSSVSPPTLVGTINCEKFWIDANTVEDIFQYIDANYKYEYNQLQAMYQTGNIGIEKDGTAYRVTIVDANYSHILIVEELDL